MNWRAAKTSVGDLNSNFTVASGSPITIFGFVIANSSSSDVEVTWTTAESSPATIGYITVRAHDNGVVPIEWIADKGIIFTSASSASIHVTVFHSNAGA